VKTKFKVIEGVYGPRLEMHSPWTSQIEKIISKRGIVELELNDGKGWKGMDVRFLKSSNLQNLKALEILDFLVDNVEDIHHLHDIKHLEVSTYCKTPIDFTAFPQLESVAIEWRANSKSIFKAHTLREVFVNNYTGSSLKPFAELDQLESLRLKSPRIREIGDLSTLRKLRDFALVNATRLTSLEGIQVLKTLEHFEANHNRRISNIEQIGSLTELRHLEIWDNREIDTLRPLLSLKNLEELFFYESTNIVDGDVACLMQLPKLRKTSFQNRRHYNCKREELWEYLERHRV